jgi:hypothetical protein
MRNTIMNHNTSPITVQHKKSVITKFTENILLRFTLPNGVTYPNELQQHFTNPRTHEPGTLIISTRAFLKITHDSILPNNYKLINCCIKNVDKISNKGRSYNYNVANFTFSTNEKYDYSHYNFASELLSDLCSYTYQTRIFLNKADVDFYSLNFDSYSKGSEKRPQRIDGSLSLNDQQELELIFG